MFNKIKLFFSWAWTKSSWFNIQLRPDYYEKVAAAMMKLSGLLGIVGIIFFVLFLFTPVSFGSVVAWFMMAWFTEMYSNQMYSIHMLQMLSTGELIYKRIKDEVEVEVSFHDEDSEREPTDAELAEIEAENEKEHSSDAL